MNREWPTLLAALQALTRVPVQVPYDADTLRRAVRYMPLVGLGVGGVAAAVNGLAREGLTPWVAAALSLGATLLLTGALHEDGLADCCDGLFGGRTRDAALRIMRDSRVGAFGVLGLVTVLAAKLGCVAGLADAWPALLAAHAASRFWALLPAASLPYAREGGTFAGTLAWPARVDLVLAAAFGLVPLLLLGPRAGPALLLSGAITLAVGLYARRRLGGYTGDVLGATQQLSELAVLVAALWHAG